MIRPWPIPSVIELPADLSSPLGIVAVERSAFGVGDADLDVRVALAERHGGARERAAEPTEQMNPSTLPSV